EPGVAVAERRLVEPAAERRENVADDDLLDRPRERVAARLAARRLHEAAAAQDPHHLRDVGLGDAFRARQFRDGQARALGLSADTEETAEPVLFLRGQLHRVGPPVTSSRAGAWPRPTSSGGSRAGR